MRALLGPPRTPSAALPPFDSSAYLALERDAYADELRRLAVEDADAARLADRAPV